MVYLDVFTSIDTPQIPCKIQMRIQRWKKQKKKKWRYVP
jgi:hypothetical protein